MSPPILFSYIHNCFLRINLLISYWVILFLDTWSFGRYVLCGEYWVVSLLIEIFGVHLFVPHELLCLSMLFKILAPRFLAVIDQVCCATIVFVVEVWIGGWGSRRLTLGTHILGRSWMDPLWFALSFFFHFIIQTLSFYCRLVARFLLFPMLCDILLLLLYLVSLFHNHAFLLYEGLFRSTPGNVICWFTFGGWAWIYV